MKIGIGIKLNLSKVDKQRLFKGEKGIYLDLTTFIDTDNIDQYGDNGFISQSVSKEERANNMQGAIVGNCKVFYKGESQQQGYQQPPQAHQAPVQNQGPQQQAPNNDDFDDDIPF